MGEAFLSQIVTADETWIHNFERETNRSRTRNGTNRAYTDLFLIGTRFERRMETLWKNKVWRQTFSLEYVLFS
jgi:predicted Ser/Thr protein kinase